MKLTAQIVLVSFCFENMGVSLLCTEIDGSCGFNYLRYPRNLWQKKSLS